MVSLLELLNIMHNHSSRKLSINVHSSYWSLRYQFYLFYWAVKMLEIKRMLSPRLCTLAISTIWQHESRDRQTTVHFLVLLCHARKLH